MRVVKLEWNEISHRGAQLLGEFLAENDTLESLDLYGCRVRDTGARSLALALSKNKTLTHRTLDCLHFLLSRSYSLPFARKTVGLFNCGINDDGATHLARHLFRNTTLKFLNLDNNNIDDDLVDFCHACTSRNSNEDAEFPDIHEYVSILQHLHLVFSV